MSDIHSVKKRCVLLLIIFFAIAISLIIRLAFLQIVKGPDLQRLAFQQQNRDNILSPMRGTIYDRNGKVLAISASVETIAFSPNSMRESNVDSETIALGLSDILGLDYSTTLEKINKNSVFETLIQKVEVETGDLVRKFVEENNILGMNIYDDYKRYYPYNNLACHVLGFTGTDNQGLEGLEIVLDTYLKGVAGKIISQSDISKDELPYSYKNRIEAENGLNSVLTIDETIQYIAESALEKAMIENDVRNGGVAIVMDPRNGDILAMVSKPDYNLNSPFACPEGYEESTWCGTSVEDTDILRKTVWKNKAVFDLYEPGSTFKAFTAAAGIEEGVITPETIVNDKPVTVLDSEISCWSTPIHGTETFREAVYNSCNPVFVKVAIDLGVDKFYEYIKAFGFYEKTGITLPGEQIGYFHEIPTILDMAVASFGQRFIVTPIEMITAYCAIANGGYLVEPQLVKEIVNNNGSIVESSETNIIRQVISEETSEVIRDILEGVVSEGTGRNAFVPGYRVAGKTGTSQTIDEDIHIASFIGFAPADNPVLCVLVMLDDPQGYSYSGGIIAAPVVGSILEDSLSYLQVARSGDDDLIIRQTWIPDVVDETIASAIIRLKDAGLEYIIEGDKTDMNANIIKQSPTSSETIAENSLVVLYTEQGNLDKKVAVPNLINKNIYEATQALNKIGLNIVTSGMGLVISQEYSIGTQLEPGQVVEVVFRHTENIEVID